MLYKRHKRSLLSPSGQLTLQPVTLALLFLRHLMHIVFIHLKMKKNTNSRYPSSFKSKGNALNYTRWSSRSAVLSPWFWSWIPDIISGHGLYDQSLWVSHMVQNHRKGTCSASFRRSTFPFCFFTLGSLQNSLPLQRASQ